MRVVQEQEQTPLTGQVVAFTGRMASMTRAEAAETVHALGGRYVRTVTAETTLLIVGRDLLPVRRDGRLGRNLQRARSLQTHDRPIEIITEDAFLERIGFRQLQENVKRLHSLDQLVALLQVSRDWIRSWVRLGLVKPVESIQGQPYFDYRQVASLKTLCRLKRAGLTTPRIRRSLEALRQWLPDVDDTLACLDRLHEDRRLIARSPDGRLLEPNGQIVIDFEEPEETNREERAVIPLPAERPSESGNSQGELFDLAAAHEDAGRFEEAEQCYRQWLRRFGPDPEVCFNLGNICYAQKRFEAAVERFSQSVEADPDFTDAWCNLGATLAELKRHEDAVRAAARALELDPRNGNARYNIAEALEELGRFEEARRHWKQYLKQDPQSEWADYARARLES